MVAGVGTNPRAPPTSLHSGHLLADRNAKPCRQKDGNSTNKPGQCCQQHRDVHYSPPTSDYAIRRGNWPFSEMGRILHQSRPFRYQYRGRGTRATRNGHGTSSFCRYGTPVLASVRPCRTAMQTGLCCRDCPHFFGCQRTGSTDDAGGKNKRTLCTPTAIVAHTMSPE